MFLLSFSGCGYKGDPFYSENISVGDENVEFKVRKQNDTSKE